MDKVYRVKGGTGTGYTFPVLEGEVDDPREYLKDVARAFGAFVHQRDSASGPAKEPEIQNLYYSKSLAESITELEYVRGWTKEQKEVKFEELVEKLIAENERSKERNRKILNNIDRMINLVRGWECNTQAAQVKAYALDQLTGTRKSYESPYLISIPTDAESWYQDELLRLERQVERDRSSADDEIQRLAERKAYARLVLDSIDSIDYNPLGVISYD